MIKKLAKIALIALTSCGVTEPKVYDYPKIKIQFHFYKDTQMNDYELRTNKVYQIRTVEDVKLEDKIIAEKGKLITAKWETLFFTDDYDKKYFLGQVEVIRKLGE